MARRGTPQTEDKATYVGRMLGQLFKRWVSAAVGLYWSSREFTGDREGVGLRAMKEEPWQAKMTM